MANYYVGMTVPILKGKEEELREFAKALSGPKKKEFDKLQKRFATTRERWFIQQSPAGSMFIAYFENKADPAKGFQELASSKDPFSVWFKDKFKELTGIDFNNPPAGSLPEQILTYGY
jgi:hypothetical protein